MNGSRLLADTNVIVNLAKGLESAEQALQDKDVFISVITYMELLSRPDADASYIEWMEEVVKQCTILELSPAVTQSAINIRKHRRLKLPDAIIAASAAVYGLTLVTYDSQFESASEIDLVLLNA